MDTGSGRVLTDRAGGPADLSRCASQPDGAHPSRIVVTGSFTAMHSCVEGRPHKHTWTVTAWFQPPARADATLYRAALDQMLEAMDGTTLPAEADWNEDIAARIGKLVNCVRVRVWRQAERIGAEWSA